MQEVVALLWDDLEHTATGAKVAAEHTVTLGHMGRWYELDLSTVNSEKLAKDLAPWLDAARRVAGGGKLPEAPSAPVSRRNVNPATAAYNKRLREFADANGFNYKTASGATWYPRALRDAFEAHLQKEAEASAQS